jgi:hypothetical protein
MPFLKDELVLVCKRTNPNKGEITKRISYNCFLMREQGSGTLVIERVETAKN